MNMVRIFKSQTLNGMLYLNRNRFGRLTEMLGLLPRALPGRWVHVSEKVVIPD